MRYGQASVVAGRAGVVDTVLVGVSSYRSYEYE
jgi:hypothetical protein